MHELFLPSLVVLFASSMQACTGFGFSIMATPFLLFFFPAHTAIQLNIVLSIAISLLMLPDIGRQLDRGLLKRMAWGSIPGAPVGGALFVLFDVQALRLAVSVVTIALTVLLALRLRVAQTKPRDVAAGALSGAFTTSLGMPGLPLLLYFAGTEVEQRALRSTVLAFFLGMYSAALVVQALYGVADVQTWTTALLLLPATFVGVALGRAMFRRLSTRAFRAATFAILIATAGYLLYTSI